MTAYDLPEALEVGGVEYPIRTDFRCILDILIATNDPDLSEYGKQKVILKIIYPGWANIPPEHIGEALKKACSFIDCGQKPDGKKHPKLIDWEQDAQLIIPAVNSVAHSEVRAMNNLHWWTFFSWFMEIGESTLSTVIHIRDMKSRGKKLDKAENEWYRRNKNLVDFERKNDSNDDEILKAWGINR